MHDAEMVEKTSKILPDEITPPQQPTNNTSIGLTGNGVSTTAQPMRAPTLQPRSATVGASNSNRPTAPLAPPTISKPSYRPPPPPPIAPTPMKPNQQLPQSVSAASMLAHTAQTSHQNQNRIKTLIESEATIESDQYSNEADESILEKMDLDASVYQIHDDSAMTIGPIHEGDSGFSEGGLFNHVINEVVKSKEEEEEEEEAVLLERKKLKAEEIEKKRQIALQKQRNAQQQQLLHKSPPNAAVGGMQRSKTAGNPSTANSIAIAAVASAAASSTMGGNRPQVVQAGNLPTLNMAGGAHAAIGSSRPMVGSAIGGDGNGGGFMSAKGMKRSLIDE